MFRRKQSKGQGGIERDSEEEKTPSMEQNIVDFTPGDLMKRRLNLALHLEDALEEFWCSTGLNNLTFDSREGMCGFICGPMLYMFVMSDDDQHFTISATVHNVNPDDDADKLQATLKNEIKKLETKSEMTLRKCAQEIVLNRLVSVSFLTKSAFDDFSEIIEEFLEMSKTIRKVFKTCRKPKPQRKLFAMLRSSKAKSPS